MSDELVLPFAFHVLPFPLSQSRQFWVHLQNRFCAAVSEMQAIWLACQAESLLSERVFRFGLPALHHVSHGIHRIYDPDLAWSQGGNEIGQRDRVEPAGDHQNRPLDLRTSESR